MAGVPQAAELEAMLQTAVSHHRAGRLSEAQRLYRDILQLLPDHPVVNNSLGIALKGQGKSEEAATVFRRLTTVAPDYAPAHSNLGNILFEQRRLEEAEAAYRRALAVNPGHGRCAQESRPGDRRQRSLRGKLPMVQAPRRAGLWKACQFRCRANAPHKAKHDQEQRDYVTQVTGAAAPMFRLEEGGRVPGRAVNPDMSQARLRIAGRPARRRSSSSTIS